MKPLVITKINEFRKIRAELKGTIGFVPTMGYLHAGHLSLVREAAKKTDITVVSIFVNPTQFAPNEDLSSYPRDFETDLKKLTDLDTDIVFFPSVTEMYPNDFQTRVEVTEITKVLCGKSRPSHFQGVTTVVTKLINIIEPNQMFMGEKDFQQLRVLQQMKQDLNMKLKIIGCSIVRENDGLAMSSRNKYLNIQERKNALCLYKSLILAKKMFQNGKNSVNIIKKEMVKYIKANDGRIDYVEFIDSHTLRGKDILQSGDRALVAVFIGETRLIDNMEM